MWLKPAPITTCRVPAGHPAGSEHCPKCGADRLLALEDSLAAAAVEQPSLRRTAWGRTALDESLRLDVLLLMRECEITFRNTYIQLPEALQPE